MQKSLRKSMLLSLIVSSLFLLLTPFISDERSKVTVLASAPYGTMTMGPNNSLVATQNAYEPNKLMWNDLENPQDLYYDEFNEELLIADTGNKRVVILDKDGNLNAILSEDLAIPTGVTADENYYYVADKGNKVINVYLKETRALNKKITRPETSLFGTSSPFVPLKIRVNPKGIYLVSEGATKGVIQLNLEGEFIGYVGANRTPQSFQTFLQGIFFSKQQKESILKAAPHP